VVIGVRRLLENYRNDPESIEHRVASGKRRKNRVRNGFRRRMGRGSGQFAESALDTLYVARNRGRIDIVAFDIVQPDTPSHGSK
jgi:hypothetical protein